MLAVAAKPATAALILRDWLDSENGMLMRMVTVDMGERYRFCNSNLSQTRGIVNAYPSPCLSRVPHACMSACPLF